MLKNIYGLNYDYLQMNGNFLVINKDNGLYNEDLVDIQVKMLQLNHIPNLLPVEIHEKDFKVEFIYSIEQKRLLKNVLKSKGISKKEYFQLLLNIVQILDNSKKYMLSEKNYIINENFIYIGKDMHDIYLTYLPLNEIEHKGDIRDEFPLLAMNLVGMVDSMQGNRFQQLIDFFHKEESFSLSELKKKISEIMEGESQSEHQMKTPSIVNEYNYENLSKQELAAAHIENSYIKENQSHNKNMNRDEQQQEGMSERNMVLILTTSFLFIALIWRGYLAFQAEGMLYISVGLTLLIIDFNYIAFKIGLTNILIREKGNHIKKKDITPKTPYIHQSPSYPKTSSDISNHYNNLENQTTLLSNGNETAILSEEELSNPYKYVRAYLEVDRGQRIEQITITGDSFVIGRNPTSTNYIEDAVGISRVHIEIIRDEQGFAIRDLGSKNGTYLNNQDLIPNKIYSLKDGDTIRIAKTEFTFKMGL